MKSDRVWKGAFLIIVGVALLMFQLNLIPDYFPHYLFTWESGLIFLGLFTLIVKRDVVPAFILATIGTVFLLKNYFYPWINPLKFWPLLIIIVGLGIIFKRKKSTGYDACLNGKLPFQGPEYLRSEETLETTEKLEKGIDDRQMDEVAIFGGGERIITSDSFSGGSVTTIFGGSEINLLNSNLSEGRNVIEVFALFGGSTFIVPRDWKVRIEVIAIFGGFSDKRTLMPGDVQNSKRELIIKGFVMFGGGEIKSY